MAELSFKSLSNFGIPLRTDSLLVNYARVCLSVCVWPVLLFLGAQVINGIHALGRKVMVPAIEANNAYFLYHQFCISPLLLYHTGPEIQTRSASSGTEGIRQIRAAVYWRAVKSWQGCDWSPNGLKQGCFAGWNDSIRPGTTGGEDQPEKLITFLPPCFVHVFVILLMDQPLIVYGEQLWWTFSLCLVLTLLHGIL